MLDINQMVSASLIQLYGVHLAQLSMVKSGGQLYFHNNGNETVKKAYESGWRRENTRLNEH